MSVRLHRCPVTFFKLDAHPCWRVEKALAEAGVDYEVVKEPLMRGRRERLEELSGQRVLPTIEFADGSFYRAESAEMAETIRAGKLGTSAPTSQ